MQVIPLFVNMYLVTPQLINNNKFMVASAAEV